MTVAIRMIPRSALRGDTVPSPLAEEGRVRGLNHAVSIL